MSTAAGVDESFQDESIAARSHAVMQTTRKIAKRAMMRAVRKEVEQIAAVEARLKQIEEDNATAAAQIATFQACSVNAVIRGNLAATAMKDMMRSENQQIEMSNVKRSDDVSALQKSIDSSRKDIKEAAGKKLRMAEKVREMMEAEKVLLLAEGLNPYIEFRSREVEAEAEMRARKLKRDILNNKKEIELRLIKEDEKVLKKEKEAKLNFDYEKAHRDSKARSVIEARTSQYISRVTTDGIEVLDPTGRASPLDILPSQITSIPDYSFGLGKSSRIPVENMKQITEKIRQQMKIDKDDLGEYKRLVPGYDNKTKQKVIKSDNYDDIDNEYGSENKLDDKSINFDGNYCDKIEAKNEQMKRLLHLQNLAGDAGDIPGIMDLHSEVTTDNYNSKNNNKNKIINYDTIKKKKIEKLLILAEEQGNGNFKKQNDTSNINFNTNQVKYPPIILSKYEKNCFQKAKERQLNRLNNGIEQIAAGKKFNGIAFQSEPSEIIFTDFEIELSEDIVELFTISYERMGRMSAGVSVNIEIIFSPKKNVDIHSAINFLCETGPVEIPLHCLIRRSAPRVETNIVDFGKMIIGQQTVLTLKIKNSEILSSPFTISRVKYGNERIDEYTLKHGNDYLEESEKLILADLSSEKSTGLPDEVTDFAEIDKFLSGNFMDGKKYSPPLFKPASSVAQLTERVTYMANKKMREKKKNQPEPFQVILPSTPCTNLQYTVKCEDTGGEYIGTVDGHSTVILDVVCMPFQTGVIENQFSITFDNVENASNTLDDKGKIITKEQLILFKVDVQEPPIYIKNNIIDFNCVFFNRMYRKKIEIFNKSNTANKIEINVPKIFSKFVEISPSIIFIQAKDSQIINIKFFPNVEMLGNLSYFSSLQEGFSDCATLFLPIEIQYILIINIFCDTIFTCNTIQRIMAGQDIPIPFFIKTIVTKSELSFSSSTLNFNNVYLNQNSILPITIKNGSFLPQKIGFVKVKKEIDIQPNDGFAILLPNESLEFSVNFCPSSITDYCFDLVLYTNNNDKFVIKVIGNGVRSPLLFDKYNLSLRTTSPGEKVIESITITNTHKHTICYEFVIPDLRYSWLKISPYIFELKSLQKCRVEIEFFPPENILNESAKEWFIKLKCDMINEGKEKENEKNDNNTKKNDSNDIVKIDIKNKNTDNINRSNNNDSNKNTINNNDDKNDVDNFNQSNNNDNESNDNLLLENIREPKTTFGVFTDFVEDSGLISVKNSFGQIQWLQNTELNLSNSIKSEMNDRLIVDNDSEKQNINNNELKNKKFNKIDNDNIVEISDTDLINNFKIENNSHNTITENIKNENKNDNNNNNIAINKRTKNKIDKAKNSKKKKEGIKEEITSNNISDVENENDSDLFGNQSVIYSSWSIPVFMKIIKNSENKKYENKTQILTKNLNTNKNMGKTNNNLDDEFIYSGDNIDKFRPLFFYLETVVSDPQISCDTKTVNFGQIAIGKKCLKSIKITNNTNNILQLVTYGTNAVGPFSILTPIKDLKPHEFRKIVIEFLPTETGSFTEILEYQNREEIGGHRIRISLRAYGVTPYITLTGLLPWGTSSKNGSGFLDFGNVLVNDTVLQNFTVLNQSLFDVDITLVRTSNGENSEKTISGLPLFSYRPESFLLLPGASQIITVKFRPDRSRIHPYTEEIQILKSTKSIILDDILRIGMIGKVQENQIFVHTLTSTEKIFSNNMNSVNTENGNVKNLNKMGENSSISINKETNSTNNPFNSILDNGMKKLVENSMKYSHTTLPENPSILLEFPNPYDKNTDPTSYTEIDAKTRKMTVSKNTSSSSVKSVDSLKTGGQALGSGIGGEGGRVQFKRILVESLIALDKRNGSTAAGSFEIILSAAAKDSGIWSTGSVLLYGNGKSSQNIVPSIPVPGVISGTVSPGTTWAVDFFCTLPVPKGYGTGSGTGAGGLCVGSWQSYHADIIITGGWCAASPVPVPFSSSTSTSTSSTSSPSISRIPTILRAYIEL